MLLTVMLSLLAIGLLFAVGPTAGWNPSTVLSAVLVLSAAAGCWTFVILYTRWYPWYRSEAGTHLWVFVACLGLLDTLFAVSVFWPHLPWLKVALLAAFVPEPIVVWWRVNLLIRTRRKARANEA